MKTIKEVVEDYPERKRLINAVLSRVGKSSLEDIMNHGIDKGFRGFVYYDDTVRFANRFRKDIIKMAEDMADEMGVGTAEMIANFNCLNDDKETRQAIYGYLGGGDVKAFELGTMVWNAMAWFAAEEVARMFER